LVGVISTAIIVISVFRSYFQNKLLHIHLYFG
jgi:hypothetical protein